MLIIGFGNPLRGDDAMGPIAAERLGGLAVHQLTPEMAEEIASADAVLFLDADATLAAGEVVLTPLLPGDAEMTHHASPAGLLQLARRVYGGSPKAWVIGMGGADFGLREGLTPAAERAVARALEAAGRLRKG